jgi:hypothetical protein
MPARGKEDSFIAAKSSTRKLDCANNFKMLVLSDSRGKTSLMWLSIDITCTGKLLKLNLRGI